MEKKKSINELSAASKWVDSFFDALKTNTTNRMLAKARKVNMDPRIISQLEKIQKEKDELDKLMGIK